MRHAQVVLPSESCAAMRSTAAAGSGAHISCWVPPQLCSIWPCSARDACALDKSAPAHKCGCYRLSCWVAGACAGPPLMLQAADGSHHAQKELWEGQRSRPGHMLACRAKGRDVHQHRLCKHAKQSKGRCFNTGFAWMHSKGQGDAATQALQACKTKQGEVLQHDLWVWTKGS